MLVILVGNVGNGLLPEVQSLITLADDAVDVAKHHIAEAHLDQQISNGDAGSTGTVDDDLHLAHLLPGHLHGVNEGCRHDHSRTVLIVMEYQNVALLLQLLLDLEAAGCRNVLQVHAAEGACQKGNGIHDGVHVLGADAEGNGIHITELLKEHALSFHHRHAGLRTDVAETENSGTICHHGHCVPAAGQLPALLRILLYHPAGLRHTRCIAEAQGLRAVHLGSRLDLQLSLQFIMQL